MNWQTISDQIESATGQAFNVVSAHRLSGGCINSAFRLQGDDRSYFVKLNRADLMSMFEAEFAGLKDIAKTQAVCVPAPIVCGKTAEHSFLVLEHLEFGCSSKVSDRLLGQQLALMHQKQQRILAGIGIILSAALYKLIIKAMIGRASGASNAWDFN